MSAQLPHIHHSVCRVSGQQELWLMHGGKVLAGPAPLPAGWIGIYNTAKQEALDAELGIPIRAAIATKGGVT
jgi:hypothetical protein